uniref:Venom S1 protease 16 n=1 Tax=Ectomocoris sp. TaxID=3104572 RepID=A0AB38ZE80_9HEMI
MILHWIYFTFVLIHFFVEITSNPTQETIQLNAPGVGKTISLPLFTRSPNLDRTWIIESTPGTKISFQCEINLIGTKTGCAKNLFIFNDGVNEEEFCNYKHFILFSRENKAKLTVKLDDKGIGQATCLIQSITGPNANEYENVKSEEVDSSEHGVTPGGKSTNCPCGRANKEKRRIVNGKEGAVNEFPWLVQIHILHEIGPFIKYATSCGGSILTTRHILTAAHCVVAENTQIIAKPTNLILVLGEHYTQQKSRDKQMLTGERIFIGDQYLDKGLEYDDLAIVYTKETIIYNNIVGPICIEPRPLPVLHRNVIIMGWGLTEEGTPSPYMRKSKAKVMDSSICRMKPWDLCTATQPSSLCVGDSGGPLVWLNPETNRYSQVALVSKVRPDCKGEASASTLVSYYYNWIQAVIKATEPLFTTCHEV